MRGGCGEGEVLQQMLIVITSAEADGHHATCISESTRRPVG